ncbi:MULTISPECIES: hypothetical protein [Aeromonas]|uniref:Phage protein n=1 Tax=Aeromonas salmonicida TaxID=645 RepID=A0AAX1PED4_AERSA|nr:MULTISPECIES: hypothetical protein [Aeromonas]MDU4190307.1 hypothetical protein [Aeromonas sp.]RAI98835.1 hypothetical protein DEU50_12617 [Aeromonas salmonicida]
MNEQMQDMTFTAVLALGVTTSGGAVLDVAAPDKHVRDLVLEDIRENSDREFIDVLGEGLPKSGLVKVLCEMEGWPDEYDSPDYKLISASPLALPN